jgi:hypothetical protein
MEKRARPHRYGAEAQHVLFLVWHAANRICTKRLIPGIVNLVIIVELIRRRSSRKWGLSPYFSSQFALSLTLKVRLVEKPQSQKRS